MMKQPLDRGIFTKPENWHGYYCELALELGSAGDDGRLALALAALWCHPALRGPWRERERFGQTAEAPDAAESSHHLYGVAALDEETDLPCVSHVIREEAGSDWLTLCVPTGMLELCFPVQYSLDVETNPWLRRLNQFFAKIGGDVYRAVPFQLGVIGVEVSGVVYSATITSDQCEGLPLLLPESLWERLSPTGGYERLEHGLVAVGLGGDG
jgi:hypothetical protein